MRIQHDIPKPGKSKKARNEYRRALAEAEQQARKRKRKNQSNEGRRLQKRVPALIASRRKEDMARFIRDTWPDEDLKGSRLQKISDMMDALSSISPKLLDEAHALQLRRCSQHAWIRPIRDWQPRGHGASTLLKSLVGHLFVRYTVPPILQHESRRHRRSRPVRTKKAPSPLTREEGARS